MPKRSSIRLRSLLVCGVAALFIATGTGGGCAAPFDPPGLINSLRILSVDITRSNASGGTVSGSFAQPGDTVTFTMNVFDGRSTGGVFTPLQIVWLSGCFNPPGNQYYGCYQQLGSLFGSLGGGGLPKEIGFGPVFDLTLPDDMLSSLPEPSTGPKVGVGYVFFMACAGEIGPVNQAGDTAAGAFPVGCFDSEGRQLGPEAFVPGFTQVFAFDDGRENQNPAVNGLSWDGDVLAADAIPKVPRCQISPEDRKLSGCAATDEFTECTTVELDIDVEKDVAEDDPGAPDASGNNLKEVVWVSYFATGGGFESEIKLVSDAQKGLQSDGRSTQWVPPFEAGLYELWAVIRDNRGGSTTVRHTVEVTE